jgi:hypothetical protein
MDFRAALITTAVMSAAGAMTGIGLRTRKAALPSDAASYAGERSVLTEHV